MTQGSNLNSKKDLVSLKVLQRSGAVKLGKVLTVRQLYRSTTLQQLMVT